MPIGMQNWTADSSGKMEKHPWDAKMAMVFPLANGFARAKVNNIFK